MNFIQLPETFKINNHTSFKINEDKWKEWISIFCTKPPLNVIVINNPKFTKEKMYIGGYDFEDNYRGGFLFDEIYIIVNPEETKKSLDWVFLHELAHWIIYHRQVMFDYAELIDKEFRQYIKKSNLKLGKYYDDNFSFEEVFADLFAIMILDENYSAEWFEERGK